MSKKLLLILSSIFIFCIIVAVLDVYILKNDGLGLSFGIGMFFGLIIFPIIFVATVLYGAVKIIRELASSKLSSSKKKDMLKRAIIVVGISVLSIVVFNILNSLGTALIDI